MNYTVIAPSGLVVDMIVMDEDVANLDLPTFSEEVWPGAGYVLQPATEDARIGDTFESGQFVPAPVPPEPPMTAEQAGALRDSLLAAATLRIAPLQDAVDLDDASPADKAALKAWKQYRVALSRIEQSSGFPADVEWPTAPN